MTIQRIGCSGKSHPNASKSRAKETCPRYIDMELDSLAPGFQFLCRNCAPVVPPPPNTFAGKQFDKSVGRGGTPDPEKARTAPRTKGINWKTANKGPINFAH